MIEIPAIAEPHQGTSYNPPLDAHTELIVKANNMEERRAQEAERLVEVKDRIGKAIAVLGLDAQEGVASGMVVDDRADEKGDVEQEDEEEKPLAKKAPERKTKQQKAKAARLRAEVRKQPFSSTYILSVSL